MIRNDAEIIAGRSKAWFARPRPYAVDASIAGCPYKANKPVLTSYPSGHATNGFSYGFVLAALMPEHSTEILRRARDYADQRLVCGHHYRSDVDASAILASEFARDAYSNPEFVRRLNAVRAELRSAGFLK
jgi:acid phosphatase (class A)